MTLDVLSNVLYNVSFYGSIIALIASFIILIFKIDLFKGIGKTLCRIFIVTWILYLGMSISTMVITTIDNNDNTKKTSWNTFDKTDRYF